MITRTEIKKQQFERDKQNVLEWYTKYAFGYKNVKSREQVLPFLLTHKSPIESRDRYLREITSELIHEGRLASLSGKGTWAVPLSTNDQVEVEMLLKSLYERRTRALSSLEDVGKQIQAAEAKIEPQLFERAG